MVAHQGEAGEGTEAEGTAGVGTQSWEVTGCTWQSKARLAPNHREFEHLCEGFELHAACQPLEPAKFL